MVFLAKDSTLEAGTHVQNVVELEQANDFWYHSDAALLVLCGMKPIWMTP